MLPIGNITIAFCPKTFTGAARRSLHILFCSGGSLDPWATFPSFSASNSDGKVMEP